MGSRRWGWYADLSQVQVEVQTKRKMVLRQSGIDGWGKEGNLYDLEVSGLMKVGGRVEEEWRSPGMSGYSGHLG